VDRRSFIKLTAITGTGTALASCGHPENQVIRFLPDEELTPGVAEWKPSVCPLCASGCGLTVRVMEAEVEVVRDGQAGITKRGVAKKLEGNPAHPVNRGALCARGQGAIQATFHPDRITRPLKRGGTRGDGKYEELTWDQAIGELAGRLDALATASDQKSLAYLRSRVTGQRAVLIEQFLAGFGAPPPITVEIFGDEVLRRANLVSFGREQLPTFDLANARFVLSFGADFLGTWNSPVSHSMAYGEMRQGRPGVRGAFVQIESRMTQTGANADRWVPTRPGTEGVLALGLAHVMIEHKLASGDASRAGGALAGWSSGLEEYNPKRVQEITGVPAHRVEELAQQFASHTPAVAIAGGPALAHTNGLFTAVAVNALNALAGSVGKPGGLFFTPQVPGTGRTDAGRASSESDAPNASVRTVDKLAAGIASGQSPVQILLIDGGNPLHTSPASWKLQDAIQKVPFIASFGSFLDDTTAYADLILPDHTFLEAWVDAVPESGSLVPVVSFAPPAMLPLHNTRSTGDVIIELAGKLQKPVAIAHKKFEDMVKAGVASLPAPAAKPDADVPALVATQGGWWGDPPKGDGEPTAVAGGARPAANALAYAEPQFDGDAGQYPYHFLPVLSSNFLDGSLAHLPWLQEMPDPLTSAMWSSWVEINPTTAGTLGIHDEDIVEVASAHGSLQAAAILTPGIAPDIVAMPAGQGHKSFTRFATGRGENPLAILAPIVEPETGTIAWAATRVRISRVGGPDGRLVLFARSKYEKPNHGRR
jgi:anaerobic selenocysteine-containing dehydrogenase